MQIRAWQCCIPSRGFRVVSESSLKTQAVKHAKQVCAEPRRDIHVAVPWTLRHTSVGKCENAPFLLWARAQLLSPHISLLTCSTQSFCAVKLALGLNPNSKPFSPFATSGRSTPSTAAAAAASTQRSTIATITEVAHRITPRSHSEAAQQNLPSQGIVTGTLLSCQAGEASGDRDNGPGSGTAGGSTGIGESTESQVQRELGITVHADGLRSSVTPFAWDPAATPPGEIPSSKAEPQSSGEPLKPLQGGGSPETVKRPSPEVLVPPAMDAGDPSPARSTGEGSLSGKAMQEMEARSTVSICAQPPPVCAPSSSGQTPVHAPQSTQPAQQHVAAPPAQTGVLTAGQQGQLSPPAGAAQQAGSAPQVASPGRAQPLAQLPVPAGYSVQQHPPSALPGPAQQPAGSAAPAVPVRRMLLPRVPKPGGPSIATSQHVSLSGRSPDMHAGPFIFPTAWALSLAFTSMNQTRCW